MKEVYLLTKYLLESFLKDTFKENKNLWNTIIKGVTGLGVLILFLISIVKLYSILATGNIEHLVIPIILILGSITFMILGIYLIMSNFSFAEDNEFLLSLPVSKRALFIAKFLFVEINLLPVSLFTSLGLFIYGVLSEASIIFFVYAFIAGILLSVTPIIYGIFISLIFSRMSLKSNSKEIAQGVFTILSIILSIGMVYLAIKTFMSPESILALVDKSTENNTVLINLIFPLNEQITNALFFSDSLVGLNSIIISTLLGLAFVIVSIFVGKEFYYKILLNSSNNSVRSESNKENKYNEIKSQLIILTKRDFLSLMKSSQFFLYTVGMFPIFLLIVCAFIPMIEPFVTLEGLGENYIIPYVYLMYLSSFFASFNVTASTSFSREGRYLPLLLQMPINIRTLLYSKIIIALSLSSLMIGVNLILLIFLKLPLGIYILMGISMFVFTLFIVMTSILNDVDKPNTKWCFEKDLVKDNMSLYKSAAYPMVFVPVVLIVHLILNKTPLPYTIQFYLLATTLIITGLILTMKCYKKILSKLNTLYNI